MSNHSTAGDAIEIKIVETRGGFRQWLDSYAEQQNEEGCLVWSIGAALGASEREYSLPVMRGGYGFGEVRITVTTIAAGRLTVTLKPFNGKWPIRPELSEFLRALVMAIRKRYGGALKPPGRKKLACNRWAEDQAREGKTVKDVWLEYCDRYQAETGDDADSMVSLRKDLGDRMRKATGDK